MNTMGVSLSIQIVDNCYSQKSIPRTSAPGAINNRLDNNHIEIHPIIIRFSPHLWVFSQKSLNPNTTTAIEYWARESIIIDAGNYPELVERAIEAWIEEQAQKLAKWSKK